MRRGKPSSERGAEADAQDVAVGEVPVVAEVRVEVIGHLQADVRTRRDPRVHLLPVETDLHPLRSRVVEAVEAVVDRGAGAVEGGGVDLGLEEEGEPPRRGTEGVPPGDDRHALSGREPDGQAEPEARPPPVRGLEAGPDVVEVQRIGSGNDQHRPEDADVRPLRHGQGRLCLQQELRGERRRRRGGGRREGGREEEGAEQTSHDHSGFGLGRRGTLARRRHVVTPYSEGSG